MSKEGQEVEKGVEQLVESAVLGAGEIAERKGKMELVILKGNAPEPKKTYEKKPVTINGVLDAPRRFSEVRVYKKEKSHALVSKSLGSIELIVNEQSTDTLYKVSGQIRTSKTFDDFGINTEKAYSPEKLAAFLKLRRACFKVALEHGATVTALRNVKAKIDSTYEKLNDQKGNTKDLMSVAIDSNIPESFVLKMPIVEGGVEHEFTVDILLELDSNNKISCMLESVDAAEILEREFNTAIEKEVEYLEQKTTVIYV